MQFPAKLTPDRDDGGFVVTFRDIPEAITQGDDRAEALDMAADALMSALEFYFEDRRPVPPPSPARRGEVHIPVPPGLAVKVLLLNEMLAQGVSAAELARRMQLPPQAVNRVMNPRHATKIDTLAAALSCLDRRLSVSLA